MPQPPKNLNEKRKTQKLILYFLLGISLISFLFFRKPLQNSLYYWLFYQKLAERIIEDGYEFDWKQFKKLKPEIQMKLIPTFALGLKNKDVEKRKRAITALNFTGYLAKPVFLQIKASLKDPDEIVRNYALKTLSQLDLNPHEIIPELILALQDKEKEVQRSAAVFLRKFEQKLRPFLPQLLPLLKNKDTGVREKTLWVISLFSPEEKTLIPVLIPLLRDPNETIQTWSLSILAEFGNDAQAALPEIEKLYHLKSVKVQRKIINLLERIEGPNTLPILLSALNHANSHAQNEAIIALGKLGKNSQEGIFALTKLLKTAKKKKVIIEALRDIGPPAKIAIPYLLPFLFTSPRPYLKSTNQALRAITGNEYPYFQRIKLLKSFLFATEKTAKNTLLQLPVADQKELIPTIEEALKLEDIQVRNRALFFLETLANQTSSSNETLLKVLLIALVDSETQIQYKAALIFHKMGHKAKKVKKELALIQKKQTGKIQELLQETLNKFNE